MNIVKLRDFKEYNLLYEMWNKELGFIFPITKKLFEKNVFSYGDKVLDSSFVCLINNQPVGFIIGKIWEKDYDLPTYEKSGWISLIYVMPGFRNQGIGSKLLNLVEEIFEKQNKEVINLGRDYFNFFPGLPTDLKYYRDWFSKRGYTLGYDTNDLVKHVTVDTKKEMLKPFKDGKNYQIRRANINDLSKIDVLIKNNWPGRWHIEFLDYVEKGGTGYEYMICIDELENVVGFCKFCDYNTPTILTSYSLNFHGRFEKIGGIGPLGVDINYRRRNIANNILKSIINELIDKGVADIIIDWTNLMHIYRNYGFEIWKSYTYTQKEIICQNK
ncbi:MAG: GNAT family N-acetyltransferase [Bacilli bacterium]|nr:GNAT family N-acetyltransferase [Bacilli bacterium]